TRLQGDWSSDVCSSDLRLLVRIRDKATHLGQAAGGDPSVSPEGSQLRLGEGHFLADIEADLHYRSAGFVHHRRRPRIVEEIGGRSEERRVGKKCGGRER